VSDNFRIDTISNLDKELCLLAKQVKILSTLSWQPEVTLQFLECWHKGKRELPKVQFFAPDLTKAREGLASLIAKCDAADPIQLFLAKTAASYVNGAKMLESIGHPDFSKYSVLLYGSPDSCSEGEGIDGEYYNVLTTALKFIETSNDVIAAAPKSENEYCIMPQAMAETLQSEVDKFFSPKKIQVVIDEGLAAKAAAGAERIRIRGSTCFSPQDTAELIHHEAFVHTLTMLNGKEQPVLSSLALGAPRTTCSQEGMAIFAEFITNSMSIGRLRRIALRVKAIEMALSGADFFEVFGFFLGCGQDEQESFYSTMRIFRGGDLRGKGICNTKDVSYLRGFLAFHRFLLRSMHDGEVEYSDALCAGRMALVDVQVVCEAIACGIIKPAQFVPPWIKNRHTLLAFLLLLPLGGCAVPAASPLPDQ
jgi:uncharacterized protein (TIGR02421 family)